ncbi:MAG TPA: 30S ribosomal protein S7 [bacterium]|nr:30S ribosomal protein S7 [bacterium]
MPRKGRVKEREIGADLKYNSELANKFINKLMLQGKRSIAERIFYQALELAAQKLSVKPLEVLEKAIANVRPHLEVRSRRVGGATYQVPMEVRDRRAIHLALKWILGASREKKGKPMLEKLSQELIASYNGEGAAIKKRDDMHKMAEANRAFAHYRW